MSNFEPHLALIGGGTGSFTLLQELKNFTPNISAIVNMSDDGGSTGVLRDELGVLPPGDVRQCLVALSNLPDIRNIFNHRFNAGMLAGHSLGNIILSGLEQQYDGDFEKAVETASRMLNITGEVIPVTLQNHTLVMEDNGKTVKGQYEIEKSKISHQATHINHDPVANINPRAEQAIKAAELLVIAPGNLYASIIPALAVNGMASSIKQSQAKKIFVSNLVNKPDQTDEWHVVDYVKEIENYIGEGQIDYILYNNEPPSHDLLEKYAQDGEFPTKTEAKRFNEVKAKALGSSLVSKTVHSQDKSDSLRRTLIRHDAVQVRQLLEEIYGPTQRSPI